MRRNAVAFLAIPTLVAIALMVLLLAPRIYPWGSADTQLESKGGSIPAKEALSPAEGAARSLDADLQTEDAVQELPSAQPEVAAAQKECAAEKVVEKLAGSLNSRRHRLAALRQRIVSAYDRFDIDYGKSYDPESNAELWKELDAAICFVLDAEADCIADNEERINYLLQPWRVSDRKGWDWHLHVSLVSFELAGESYVASAYSMVLFETGGYAINSVRMYGRGPDGNYRMIAHCDEENREEINRKLAQRDIERAPSIRRLRCEALRLSLFDTATVKDGVARIGTMWTLPTGKGFLICWIFDGRRLRVSGDSR